MLEFKNVTVCLPDGLQTTPFSLEMDGGEVACLAGGPDGAGSLLLRAVMGLEPLAGGYITIDGELVTPGSSGYFRRLIAYVPRRMPSLRMKVGSLFGELLQLEAVADLDMGALQRQWTAVGLPDDLAQRWTTEVEPGMLQTAMLAAVPLLGRPIVLVDAPPPTPVISQLLETVAAGGAEVLCAAGDDASGSAWRKTVNISVSS